MFWNVFGSVEFILFAIAGGVVLWLWKFRPQKYQQYQAWREGNRQAVRNAGASVVRTVKDKVAGPHGPERQVSDD